MSDSSATPQSGRQLTFAEVENRLKQSGVGELPEGAANLKRREFAFVTYLLSHGQMARAAREAGYAPDSAGAIASETLRKPKVFAFYQSCLAKVANNAEQLVMRTYERSVILHAKAMEAAQEVKDLDAELLLKTQSTLEADAIKETATYESARERAVKAEKHYITLANQTDALLGALLGKLKLSTDDSGGLKGVVLSEALANELVAQRRRLQDANPAWRAVTGGQRN